MSEVVLIFAFVIAVPKGFADAVKQMLVLPDPEFRPYPGLYRIVREVG